jgi:hypothetical protein
MIVTGPDGPVLTCSHACLAVEPRRSDPGANNGVLQSRANLRGLSRIGTLASLAYPVFGDSAANPEFVRLPPEAFNLLINVLPLAA